MTTASTAIRRKTSGVVMLLAAGKGLRMRPLTRHRPKPLVEVAGAALIDRALERIGEAGLRRCVVNLHYRAAMVRKHLARRDGVEICFSDETDALLETGGGVAKALPDLRDSQGRARPFFVANSDALWLDGKVNAFDRLAGAWDGRRMDALLLLQPKSRAVGYAGAGDYRRAADGRLARSPAKSAPYVFTGLQILHPRLFDGAPGGAFSSVRLFDAAQNAGRLFGLVHDGVWMDVGTPEGVARAAAKLAELGQT
jgi:MurNAc alpha-1-phosphate uridylyltransferase